MNESMTQLGYPQWLTTILFSVVQGKRYIKIFFFYQDEEVKQVFIPAPFASFLSVRTLRSHLVSAKVYPVGERLVWSRKFNKNPYKVCKNFIKTDTFQYFLIRRFIKSIIDLQVVMSGLPLVMLGLWYALPGLPLVMLGLWYALQRSN